MPEENKREGNRKQNTWIWVVLGVVVSLAIIAMVAVGGVAYYFFSHTSFETASDKTATDRFEQVRARFTDRTPYIELDVSGEVKIHHELERATPTELSRVHILAWEADDNRLVETSVPFWFIRLKTSGPFRIQLGSHRRDLEVTAENLSRRGPGIVVDFEVPGEARVLVWAEGQ